jgi:hypothetical protein
MNDLAVAIRVAPKFIEEVKASRSKIGNLDKWLRWVNTPYHPHSF